MVDSKIIEEWLKKADEDFQFAVSVIDVSNFYAQICFHFHQAVEKYLKAFIIDREVEFKRIHDLPILLKSCMECDNTLEELMDACKFLNRFYIDARYPVHWPSDYDKEEAMLAQNAAALVKKVITKNLKEG